VVNLARPRTILFDWHATLVDTLDAMYHAVDDMLPELKGMGLMDNVIEPEEARSPEDARLVEYVRDHAQLHPKVRAETARYRARTSSRCSSGRDAEAKARAHEVFTHHYRQHFGTAKAF